MATVTSNVPLYSAIFVRDSGKQGRGDRIALEHTELRHRTTVGKDIHHNNGCTSG